MELQGQYQHSCSSCGTPISAGSRCPRCAIDSVKPKTEQIRPGHSETLDSRYPVALSRAERTAVADTKRRGLMVEFSELLSAETKRTGDFKQAWDALNNHTVLLARRKPQDKILIINAVREFERRFNDAVAQVKA